MQNIFPARELYNSNPCREMWDSEQFSQNFGSCSQGSQNSSTDLFSQSKMSQHKGFSSIDVWSQPTNSQKIPEDGSVKYYMKYMSKPPLFSSESDRQSCQQTAASYKELIESQKKQTAERDGRDVLDSFISLLKDYTKEVKSAMDSFKDSIDTTLASKAEQLASAASESADLIKKLKDDLLEGFGCLRKDMKENEELREIIAKQNKKIAEQDSEIKMLNAQLEDFRKREAKALEKQEKFLEREDKLLQKLDDISCQQQPHPQVFNPLNPKSFANQRQAFEPLQYPYQTYGAQNPSVVAFPGRTPLAWDSAEINPSSSIPLHHIHPAPQLTLQNPSAIEALPLNVQVPTYGQGTGVSDHIPQQRQDADAIVPFLNTQRQPLPSAQNHHVVTHPTATIAPMRSGSDQDQRSASPQEKDITLAMVSKDEEETLKQSEDVVSAVKKQNKGAYLTSPTACAASNLTKTARPKQSPVVTVHPQVRIKKEDEKEKMKVIIPGSPCAKKARKQDPLDIFVFNLTSSPDKGSFDAQKIDVSSTKNVPEQPVKVHATRSKKVKMQGSKKDTDYVKEVDQNRGGSTQGNLTFKVVKGNSSDSSLRGKVTPALKSKEKNGTDHKSRGRSDTSPNFQSNTPDRPVKASMENGVPRSKVAQRVFQRSKMSFKRNLVAAKRVLSFDASIFVGLEEDENIQQITESIRKHTQKRRAANVC